LLEKRC